MKISADTELVITSQRESYEAEMYGVLSEWRADKDEWKKEKREIEIILSSQKDLIRKCSALIQNLLLKIDELEDKKRPKPPTRSEA